MNANNSSNSGGGGSSSSTSSSYRGGNKYKSGRVLCFLLCAIFLLFVALCAISVRVLRSVGRQQKAAAALGVNEGVMSFVNVHFWQEEETGESQTQQNRNESGSKEVSNVPSKEVMQEQPASVGVDSNKKKKSSYSFVEGEKRLKQELRKLLELQEKGKCLGVKIKTLWKGEDVPVWECQELGITNIGPIQANPPPPAQINVPNSKNKSAKHNIDGGEKRTLTYPSPAEKAHRDATVLLQPTYGQHRQNVDAVFAFAEGYPLSDFVFFIQTLRQTGFDGDVVLSVSSPELLNSKVDNYLKSQDHVIVYSVGWKCFKKSGEEVSSPGPERDCNLLGMYGLAGEQPLNDPRQPRPLATARFELYWAWSLKYDANRLILLMDFRDTFFQLHPFVGMEHSKNPVEDGGVLYAFEENSQTNVGGSNYNARWITRAYGQNVLNKMKHYNIICSGSTMGDQYAIQIYLRAMVAQYDKTLCTQKGCDQGMHNYLLRVGGLGSETIGIKKVVFLEQGKGNVNNLGVLRTKPLSEWGLFQPPKSWAEKDWDDASARKPEDNKEGMVLNWDKSVSPVVHQYDRDEELKRFVKKRRATLERKWLASQ